MFIMFFLIIGAVMVCVASIMMAIWIILKVLQLVLWIFIKVAECFVKEPAPSIVPEPTDGVIIDLHPKEWRVLQ